MMLRKKTFDREVSRVHVLLEVAQSAQERGDLEFKLLSDIADLRGNDLNQENKQSLWDNYQHNIEIKKVLAETNNPVAQDSLKAQMKPDFLGTLFQDIGFDEQQIDSISSLFVEK